MLKFKSNISFNIIAVAQFTSRVIRTQSQKHLFLPKPSVNRTNNLKGNLLLAVYNQITANCRKKIIRSYHQTDWEKQVLKSLCLLIHILDFHMSDLHVGLVISNLIFLSLAVFLFFEAPLPSSGQSFLQSTFPLRPSCSLGDRAPAFLSNSTLHSKSSLWAVIFISAVSSGASHHWSVMILHT